MSEFPRELGGTLPPPEPSEISGPVAVRLLGEVETFIARANTELPASKDTSTVSFGDASTGELFTLMWWSQSPAHANTEERSARADKYQVSWAQPGDVIETHLRITIHPDLMQPSAVGWMTSTEVDQPVDITGDHLVSITTEATEKLPTCTPIDADAADEKLQSVARDAIGGREAREVRASIMPAIEHLLSSIGDTDSETVPNARRINWAEPDIPDRLDNFPIRQFTVIDDGSAYPAMVTAIITFDKSDFETLDPFFGENSQFVVELQYPKSDPAETTVYYLFTHSDPDTREIIEEVMPLEPVQRARVHRAIATQLAIGNLENHVGHGDED